MKKIMIILCFAASTSVNAQWLWASSAGSAGMDYAGMDYGSSTISTDQFGNSYITGLFNGPTMTFNGGVTLTNTTGHPMVFVAKYNTLGICLWAKQFGGNALDIYGNKGEAIDIDNAGNCYATGTFNGSIGSIITLQGSIHLTGTGRRQIFIVKYGPTGTAIWAKQPTGYIDANHYGRSITTDFSGNSYITGYLGATGVQFGTTPVLTSPGSFIVKYNSAGTVAWAKKIGNGADNTWSVEIDPMNNSYVVGDFAGTCTFPSGALPSIGGQNVFVAKFNAAGAFQWVKQFGAIGMMNRAWGKGISTDAYGNIFLTGYFEKQIVFGSTTLNVASMGQREAFVVKIEYPSPNNVLWAKQSTNSQQTQGNSIKASPNGDCFVAGHYSSMTNVIFAGIPPLPSNGPRHVFVVKFDINGNPLWGENSGPAPGAESPMGISYDALFNIYIAGNVQGAAQFGTLPLLTAYGTMDALIAKLKYRCN